MKLILTRHGETEENKAGIMQGHLPGKLSAEGIEQAKKLAVRLKEEKIDAIYSSDLARAADTAKEIAKYHPNTPIEFVKELRERDIGSFSGKKRSEVGSANIYEPEDGEKTEDVYKRAGTFLHEILHKHLKDTVLFVGHGGIARSLTAVIIGKLHTEVGEIEGMLNTGVSIFEIDEDKNHKVHIFNNTDHLK